MYGVVGLVCVSLFMSFSNVIGCGYGYTLLSGTYGWSLIRITNLSGCGWK